MAMGTERARETVRRLQRDITSGRWPLNTRIPTEPELAAELGVGRSTVREAVRSLAHLGMLEPAPGRGTFVRSLNPVSTVLATFAGEHSPADLLSLRQALELQAAQEAARSATDEQVARLREAHEQDKVARSQPDSIVERDRTPGTFHSTLVEVGGNDLLVQLYAAIMTAIRSAQRKGLVSSAQPAGRRHAEHALILEAVAARNPVAALAAALAHARGDLTAVPDEEFEALTQAADEQEGPPAWVTEKARREVAPDALF